MQTDVPPVVIAKYYGLWYKERMKSIEMRRL